MREQIIDRFEKYIAEANKNPKLRKAVAQIVTAYGYELINSAVFNKDLRKLAAIKYILVADNPGMDEQREERYLIGKAGKVARNFFLNSGLVKDFDSEVAVLNKTFIHTKSTVDLKKLKEIKDLLTESQIFMADLAIDLLETTEAQLWITGCSELGDRKIFEPYRKALEKKCEENPKLRERIFFYPHFSYGNFSKNLNQVLAQHPGITIGNALKEASLAIL